MSENSSAGVAQVLPTPEALYRFTPILHNQLSPDGRFVAYTVQRIDPKTEKRYSDLWVVATDGRTPPRQFTSADSADNTPRWSPDSRRIAFLSNRADERRPQLWLIALDGGEARKISDVQGSIQAFDWSPDGSRLGLLLRPLDAEALEREKDENRKKLGVVVHHITRLSYKLDGVGYLPTTHAHLWLLNPEDGEMVQLTDGLFDVEDVRWSPDGSRMVFGANLHPDPDLHYDAGQIYTIPATPGEERSYGSADLIPLTDWPGRVWSPVYSPDGQQVAFFSRDHADDWWQNSDLCVVSADGGPIRNLTAPHDLHVSSATLGDIGGSTIPQSPPTWSADGRTLWFQASRHGEQPLFALELESGTLQQESGAGVVGLFQFDRAGERLAWLAGNSENPGELFARDLGTGETVPLTQVHGWLAQLRLAPVETVWVEMADGTRIQGWIQTPPDFDPARQYPTLLAIHGGPQMQFGNLYTHEFQILAAAGFVVVFCNPRGGQGYGSDHCGAIHGRWGTVDYDDLMGFADYAAALPYVDAERMGVLGGSYGGFMTALIITRTQRFKAACAERSVTNWTSMWGSADFNQGWTVLAGVPHPWEDIALNWEQSPMSHIHKAKTPTLVIHSSADYRTNLEQGEQLFVALKVLGVETEFLIFPDEGHGLSRIGRTDRRVARLHHLQRWFTRWLTDRSQ